MSLYYGKEPSPQTAAINEAANIRKMYTECRALIEEIKQQHSQLYEILKDKNFVRLENISMPYWDAGSYLKQSEIELMQSEGCIINIIDELKKLQGD